MDEWRGLEVQYSQNNELGFRYLRLDYIRLEVQYSHSKELRYRYLRQWMNEEDEK